MASGDLASLHVATTGLAGTIVNIRISILMTAALLLAPATAEAAHCSALTKTLADFKKVSQQVDEAEQRGDSEAVCKLNKKKASLADKMLRVKNDCFHGGRKQFEFLAASARALEDMSCNASDEEFDLF